VKNERGVYHSIRKECRKKILLVTQPAFTLTLNLDLDLDLGV
jgi:hypothetical protein